ncbi:Histidine kinase [Paraburkholderia caribensis]|uniref:ATP-binding response regulator n=1 Tax=Paraburkholderia caribensis TaxID=75105 RepID=UPI001CAECA1B|nr:response regulator [Paraburkholderia caribensis]CAG9212378.1 Histidine kinase [Paraburkholderia caribensis]
MQNLPETDPPLAGWSELILNVDDNDAARLVKTRVLRRAGFDVLEASTGEQALKLVTSRKPAVVLLDVLLPDSDGVHVCKRIKQNPSTRSVLVLQTSAVLLSASDRIRALDSGADSYLTEPVEAPELVANVRALLRLWRAERALREADARKSQFLATLAHELRNPLAPMRNALELMEPRFQTSPAATRAAWQTVGRQVEHLSRLVDDLLDVSRLAHGRLTIDRGSVNVGLAIAAAVEANRPDIDARRQRLSIHLENESCAVFGDDARVVQMLDNLVSNATKYAPDESDIEIDVGQSQGMVSIRVRNQGVGILPEEQEAIFEPFIQSRRSIAASQGGLGIGLSLVRALAALHGGTVTVRSKGAGTGADFVLRLPEFIGPASLSSPRAEGALVNKGGARSILIVDDKLDDATSLAALLESHGHGVHIARSGNAALILNGQIALDVAIIDLGIAPPDGYQVARTIRAHPISGGAVLIAVSEPGQARDGHAWRAAGFDHHLVKPVAISDLLRIVDGG